jgi:ribosomal RNA-processing protein 36
MTGTFDATRFRSQYGFLSDIHKEELRTLRENLKRARKLVMSSPRDLRAEHGHEVDRLERAYKRAESTVNRDKRERVEQDALERVTREEKQKRKDGKGAFYLKDCACSMFAYEFAWTLTP